MPSSAFPLAELHCHLEGTVRPALALELARGHGVDLSGIVDEAGRYRWSDFNEFLAAYDGMCAAAIRTPEDYIAIALDYFARAGGAGLRYGEVFVSPDHAALHGISYSTFIDALASAFAEIEAKYGTVCRIVVTAVRHFSAERAEAAARLAERHPHPVVVGFGMAGDETYGRPADFAKAFAIAAGAGLGLTAHAGEIAGPESVRAALDAFPITRLGHGVRSHEEPALVEEIRARGIALELCPSSNLALGLYPSHDVHPVGAYARAGLKVTLNTDDAAFFGGDIAREYAEAAAAHGLSHADLLQITRNAYESAFCAPETKAKLLAALDQWAAAHAAGV